MNTTISRLSRMSIGNGTFRSEIKEILQNTYVMYAVLIIAILNIIGYLALRNMDAILFFILVFLLSIYFTRNMIIVLFISIIATNFYAGTSGMSSNSGRKEGLKNEKTNEDAGDEVEEAEEIKEDAEPVVDASTDMKEKTAEKTKNKPVVKTGMQNLKPAKFKPSKKTNPDDEDDSNVPVPASKNKNKNKPTKVVDDDDDDDEDDDDDGYAKISGSKGNRVDYAQTLGQAYDNLQNIIGKDGVKGLTSQTKDLMEQQKVLMNNMKDMEPLIKSAQGFMDQIMGGGGLDGISKLFDGKLFGAIAPTIAANGKTLQGKSLDENE
jgi:hypothetical protein